MPRIIPFVKAEARGNDFLVIEEAAAQGEHAAVARALCSRHTGVGADGVEFIQARGDGSWFLRLFNADGTEAELSGNGTRCVAAWLMERGDLAQVTLETHGGSRPCSLIRRSDEETWIRTGMGLPRVMERRIRIQSIAEEISGVLVNVGNPHFVLFPEREDFGSHGMTWQELGAQISVDPLFRFGVNVEFVRVLSADRIAFRIFERGCGPTESSGTGTCASAAAAMTLHGAARELTAVAPGGEQQVSWPGSAAEMLLTGPARIVCVGEARF